MENAQSATPMGRPPIGGIIWGMLLNAVVPAVLYIVSKRYFAVSEFAALAIAATFPLGRSVFELWLRRSFDPISIVVLLGIATDGIAILLGGSPQLLLVRESLFTGAFGMACFFSLLLRRPMMFYFARYFIAGMDKARQARFNASWRLPEVRFCHRMITAVWGCAFVGELVVRVILIYTVSAAAVLVISPIVLGMLMMVTMVWAFSYGQRVRVRAVAQLALRQE